MQKMSNHCFVLWAWAGSGLDRPSQGQSANANQDLASPAEMNEFLDRGPPPSLIDDYSVIRF